MTEEGFIGRWSRLKQQEQETKEELPVDAKASDEMAEITEQINQLTDEDMPHLDSLEESSDYSMFMSEKVSESLRKAALRKMFHMPSLNVVDGLDDYAEDFSIFEPLGDVITHDMQSMLEVEKTRAARKSKDAVVEESGKDAGLQVDAEQDTPQQDTAVAADMDPDLGDGDVEDV